MSDQSLLDTLQAAIHEETGHDVGRLESSMTANDIPGWDSLAHVRILFNVEERIGKPLDIKETYDASNIGELLEILKKQFSADS